MLKVKAKDFANLYNFNIALITRNYKSGEVYSFKSHDLF
jgi:hypothetical protein